MAKQRVNVDILVEDWIEVSEAESPKAFAAWRQWRAQALGCHSDAGKAFTVPSEFPPMTQHAANDYVGVLSQIRKSNGWTGESARLPMEPRPWRAPGQVTAQ